MAHFPGAAAPSIIGQHLRDLRFPIHKRQLAQHARSHGAGGEICAALEELPEKEYEDLAEVIEELDARRDVRGRGDSDSHVRHEGPEAHRSTATPGGNVKGGVWAQLVHVLRDVRFPASRGVLVQHAQFHGAEARLVAAMQGLPERGFDNIDEVMSALAEQRDANGPSPEPAGASLTEALRGIPFPAFREDLLRHAEMNGAAESLREALAGLPERRYADVAEVRKALGGGEDSSRQTGGPPQAGRPRR